MRWTHEMPLPTLGGRFFWGDEMVSGGWRIQSHVTSGAFRLLSPAKLRFAEGSFEDCLEALREHVPKPYGTRLVLLLHGLGRSWASMEPVARALEHEGIEAESLTYPSTRAGVEDHAARLIRILHRLENVREVDFVTHSLGGIVVRRALNLRHEWPNHVTPRRIVMLAPPYNGAAMARLFQNVPPVRAMLGLSLDDLARDEADADVPEDIRLLIIAGGRGDTRGLNPLIEGDDDGTVAVNETRPQRPHDFLRIFAQHSLIMRHKEAIAATLRYLQD